MHQERLKILVMWKLIDFVFAGGMFPAPRHIRAVCARSDSAASVLISRVPNLERFRTVCKGPGSGISAPTAENQVVGSLMKFAFLKSQPRVVLFFYWGHSSGVYAPLCENPGHQLGRHWMTYVWVNTRTCSETLRRHCRRKWTIFR